jgi:drug/metabolite transporter (DMT)-like permease
MLLSLVAGAVFIFTAVALKAYRPEEVAVAKLLIGSLVLLLPIRLSGAYVPMSARLWRRIIVLGLVGYAIPQFGLAWAQQFVDSSVAALFISCLPLFTLVLATIFLRERFGLQKWIGFAIGLVGLVIMIDPRGMLLQQGAGLLPYIVLALTCLSFAASGIMVQRMPELPFMQLAALALFTGGMFLLPFGLAGFISTTKTLIAAPDPSWDTLMPLIAVLMLGTVLSGFGQAIRTSIIQKYGTAFFSVVGYVVPVWAAVLGAMFLGEVLDARKALAFVVICTGLALAQSQDISRIGKSLRSKRSGQ